MLDGFIHDLEALKAETLLTGEYDANNAILRLNAGAGGTESSDWCSMLYRMFTRWAESHGYSIEVLDYLDGDVAGIKSVTIQINGENAYGRLRSEHGVHRLVRISPSMPRASARLRLSPATSCRSSRMRFMSISTRMTFASTPIVRAAQAVSTSTRLPRPSASPTCRPASL